jgi:hypothetical protein
MLCEVGRTVDDLPAAAALRRGFGLARFVSGGPRFAPVGDPHGVLIMVDARRVRFPTDDVVPSGGALVVTSDTPTITPSTSLQVGRCTVRASRG